MADTKISALTAATTPLAGTEVLPIVQSGVTKKVAVSDLTAGRDVSVKALTATDTITTASSSAIFFKGTRVASGTGMQMIGDGGGPLYQPIGVDAHQFYDITGGQRYMLINSSGVTADKGNFIIGTAGKGIADSAGTQRVYVNTSGVGIGGAAFANAQTFAVFGKSSLTAGAAGNTSTEGVQQTTSITTAKTIFTSVEQNLSSAAAALVYVYGNNNAGAGFLDIVATTPNGTPTVVHSITITGSPAARTYTMSTYDLQLAMASGTYNTLARCMTIGLPF